MSQLILPFSAASDIGAPSIRTSTSHKVYNWRKLKFWAEGGRIKINNEETGSYNSCSLREFLVRALAFSDSVKKMRYGSDKLDHQRLVCLMEQCCKDAKSQGDPHDGRQLQDKLAQGRNRIVFGSMAGDAPAAGQQSHAGYPTDHTPRYPDGTPFFTPDGPGTLLLPTGGPRLR